MTRPHPGGTRHLHGDLALARRLEGAEARGNAELLDARERVFPGSGTSWIQVAGAHAMFDGVGSPCTQTFGLGVFDVVTDDHLDRIEAFYHERGSDVFHEVSPLAHPSLLGRLSGRGYRPIEFSNVLFQPIGEERGVGGRGSESVEARIIGSEESDLWAQVAAAGWSDVAPELEDFLMRLGRVNAARRDMVCFLAENEHGPIAAGALSIFEGVALLAGASTIPQWRKQGAQAALLGSRLGYAVDQGCDVAMMVAQPGSASQRNAERRGFQVAYTRIKWHLAGGGAS